MSLTCHYCLFTSGSKSKYITPCHFPSFWKTFPICSNDFILFLENIWIWIWWKDIEGSTYRYCMRLREEDHSNQGRSACLSPWKENFRRWHPCDQFPQRRKLHCHILTLIRYHRFLPRRAEKGLKLIIIIVIVAIEDLGFVTIHYKIKIWVFYAKFIRNISILLVYNLTFFGGVIFYTW